MDSLHHFPSNKSEAVAIGGSNDDKDEEGSVASSNWGDMPLNDLKFVNDDYLMTTHTREVEETNAASSKCCFRVARLVCCPCASCLLRMVTYF